MPSIRPLEVLGALSRATDLGTGLPDEHALRTAAVAARLAALAGAEQADVEAARRVGLLHSSGCTSDAHEAALLYGEDLEVRADYARIDAGDDREVLAFLLRRLGRGSPPPLRALAALRGLPGARARARESLRGHCEVATRLADRLGCVAPVRTALDFVFERWDGRGFPDGAARETIPALARLLHVARDLALFAEIDGAHGAAAILRDRANGAYEPDLAILAADHADALLDGLDDAWEVAIAQPARLEPPLDDDGLDAALQAVADFADLKTPFTHGHAPAVSELAEAGGWRAGLASDDAARLRRAALVHELGRTGVGNDVWEQPGPLRAAQREQVRLYPYFGERSLARSSGLAPLGRLAAAHAERADGSGYPRGLDATGLGPAEQVLAAADVWVALAERRAHRAALDRADAVAVMRDEVRAGRLCADAVEAILAAAGERGERTGEREPPAGLTEREIEVLRLLALGLTNRRIAAELGIAPKTVGHHVERAYRKAGVHTRAGATLFAVEHGITSAHR
jgi:HD-GYP domain-containing protein (c-di-GMP phosphodiesterase class II)